MKGIRNKTSGGMGGANEDRADKRWSAMVYTDDTQIYDSTKNFIALPPPSLIAGRGLNWRNTDNIEGRCGEKPELILGKGKKMSTHRCWENGTMGS